MCVPGKEASVFAFKDPQGDSKMQTIWEALGWVTGSVIPTGQWSSEHDPGAASSVSLRNLWETNILRPHPGLLNQTHRGLGLAACVLTSPLEDSEAHSSWRTWALGNKTAPKHKQELEWRRISTSYFLTALIQGFFTWKAGVRNNNNDLKVWLNMKWQRWVWKCLHNGSQNTLVSLSFSAAFPLDNSQQPIYPPS